MPAQALAAVYAMLPLFKAYHQPIICVFQKINIKLRLHIIKPFYSGIIITIMATPHKDCGTDTQSDCPNLPQEY